MDSIILQEDLTEYNSKFPLTRNLFWNRIETAIDLAQIKDDDAVLDIGCNKGYLLKNIREYNTKCTCYGVDIELHSNQLDFINCYLGISDAKHLPFPNETFDVVFVLDTLEHIKEVDVAILEIQRVLTSNGVVILSGPTETWFYKLCRFIQHGKIRKPMQRDKYGNLREIDNHFHTVYDLENKFNSHNFKQIKQKSLPNYPIPELFRITKFQK